MKKTLTAATIALSLSVAPAPAMAADDHAQWVDIQSLSMPIYRMFVGLLLPAIQDPCTSTRC